MLSPAVLYNDTIPMIKIACALTIILLYLCYLELELVVVSIAGSRAAAVGRSENIFRHSSRKILAVLKMMLGIRIEYIAPARPIPPQTIIVSNHQSYFDILITRVFFGRHRIRFIAKQTLERGFPAVSRLMRIQRHAFINRRADMFTTMKTIRNFSIRLARSRLCPVIFPEGTCASDGVLLPFLSAGLRQAVTHLDASITAVVISNSYRLNRLFRLKMPDRNYPVRIAVIKRIDNRAEKRSIARNIDTLEAQYRTEIESRQ